MPWPKAYSGWVCRSANQRRRPGTLVVAAPTDESGRRCGCGSISCIGEAADPFLHGGRRRSYRLRDIRQGSTDRQSVDLADHLEFDWESPVWHHWPQGLADGHMVVRYDERGCGLSDGAVEDLSLEAWVADLEAVVDAAGLERFALLGISHGGPIVIAYAARHPERVSHLVLYGTYTRGRSTRSAQAREEAELLVSLVRVGWGQANPAFRRAFTTLFIPGATPEGGVPGAV